MGRLGIYIPDALEVRLKAFKDRINWSKIAQEAFERVIRREELMDMNVEKGKLERLRASRADAQEDRNAEGVATGKQWALDVADYAALERVASLDVSGLEWDEDNRDTSAQRMLSAALTGEENLRWDDIADVFEARFGRKNVSYHEIQGFIEGATDIYSQVD